MTARPSDPQKPGSPSKHLTRIRIASPGSDRLTRFPSHSLRLARMLLATSLLVGCASNAPQRLAENRPYPSLRQAETLDVQVFRRGTIIDITNTTAHTLGPGTLWLNMWFSREFDALPPGARTSMNLAEFTDQYGEAFRGGGFWATEAPYRLALAQLELPAGDQPARLVGLVVVGNTTGR